MFSSLFWVSIIFTLPCEGDLRDFSPRSDLFNLAHGSPAKVLSRVRAADAETLSLLIEHQGPDALFAAIHRGLFRSFRLGDLVTHLSNLELSFEAKKRLAIFFVTHRQEKPHYTRGLIGLLKQSRAKELTDLKMAIDDQEPGLLHEIVFHELSETDREDLLRNHVAWSRYEIFRYGTLVIIFDDREALEESLRVAAQEILNEGEPSLIFHEPLQIEEVSTDATSQFLLELKQLYPEVRIHALVRKEDERLADLVLASARVRGDIFRLYFFNSQSKVAEIAPPLD